MARWSDSGTRGQVCLDPLFALAARARVAGEIPSGQPSDFFLHCVSSASDIAERCLLLRKPGRKFLLLLSEASVLKQHRLLASTSVKAAATRRPRLTTGR